MINLGLSRITALVSKLPTKQTWKAIHIAGTNGKGSVAAYLSSLFIRLSKPIDVKGELKVGRFTSPHLIDRWDCITINDKPVSEAIFLQVENQVKAYASQVASEPRNMKSTGDDENENDASNSKSSEHSIVTEFELLTATAFEIFSQQNCQVAIVECGLGGRLDATNVLKPHDVACTVITKIGIDHIGILGDTVEAIAREKAGIAKLDVPMIIDGSNQDSVVNAISGVVNSLNVLPDLSSRQEVENAWNFSRDEAVGVLPDHQYNNLVLAISSFIRSQQTLPNLSFTTPTRDCLATVLDDVRSSYPARLQHLQINSLFPNYSSPILLDGAHNPQSAAVLKSYLDNLATTASRSTFTSNSSHQPKVGGPNPRTWILGMSKGKDFSRILHCILEPGDSVITCLFGPVDGMPWVSAMDPHVLAKEAEKIVCPTGSVMIAGDVVDALDIAIKTGDVRRAEAQPSVRGHIDKNESENENGIEIVVAGSLYLASDLLRAIRDGPDAVRRRFDTASST